MLFVYFPVELYSERSRESSKHYCRKFGAADADTDLGGAGGSRWRRLANDKTPDLAERRPGPGFMDNPWMSDIKVIIIKINF